MGVCCSNLGWKYFPQNNGQHQQIQESIRTQTLLPRLPAYLFTDVCHIKGLSSYPTVTWTIEDEVYKATSARLWHNLTHLPTRAYVLAEFKVTQMQYVPACTSRLSWPFQWSVTASMTSPTGNPSGIHKVIALLALYITFSPQVQQDHWQTPKLEKVGECYITDHFILITSI